VCPPVTDRQVDGYPPPGTLDDLLGFELLEATADDSPVAKYIARRGAGMHHLALRVEDIEAAIAELKSRGVRLIDETPRPGAHATRVAFVHPSSTHGVLVELVQKP